MAMTKEIFNRRRSVIKEKSGEIQRQFLFRNAGLLTSGFAMELF
jgi:hypothetical protein